MSISSRYDAALDEAGCSILQNVGAGFTDIGLGLLLAPGFQKPGALAFGTGALATYASSILCPYQEGGKGAGGDFCDVRMNGVCIEFEQGEGTLLQEYDGEMINAGIGNYVQLMEIGCDKYGPDDSPDSKGYYSTYRDIKYTQKFSGDEVQTSEVILYYKANENPVLGSEPITTSDPNVDDGVCTLKPRAEPWEGKDANNCDITMQAIGTGATPGGNLAPIMLVERGHQKQKWLDEKQWERTQPGVINESQPPAYNQNCNFAPTLIYPTPGGDPVVIPIQPGEDIQDALDRLGDEMNDRFDETDGNLNDINDKLDDILDELPEGGGDFPVPLGSWVQEFKSVCDVDDIGNPAKVNVTSYPATKASEALIALSKNQQLLVQVLQQHLDWKTPICTPEKPELKGDFVTIHFESDQDSPSGERPLRKLFRYRTESSRTSGQLREYWKDFVWQAGNTCVQHSGASWGTPQVWAASESEGKRVIQHAGREAGIDPDQVGKWTVSGSDNTRYGMSGKMRRSLRLGDYWLTSRDGPSELPWQRADP